LKQEIVNKITLRPPRRSATMPRSGGMARVVRRRQSRSEKENQDIIVSIGMLISENTKNAFSGMLPKKQGCFCENGVKKTGCIRKNGVVFHENDEKNGYFRENGKICMTTYRENNYLCNRNRDHRPQRGEDRGSKVRRQLPSTALRSGFWLG
jgi:hypothetical protein